MDFEFENEYRKALQKLERVFGQDIDLQGALFLIGVHELGQGKRKFTKDQKIDVLHIAVCKLLSFYGFYEYQGLDKDGWPHYVRTQKLPHLQPEEQERLIKKGIIDYMKLV